MENDSEVIDICAITKQIKELNREIDKFNDTHICIECGKLIKDCECKDVKRIIPKTVAKKKQVVQQDDDMDDLEFDEMNDVWDEMDSLDDLDE